VDPCDAADAAAPLAVYRRARDYLDRELVRLEPRRRDPAGKVATARAFNADLGDPQRCAPAVQVAGTSGKGSVAALVAEGLRAAGLRTGLHVSPYLQVHTEKTWVDGRYASAEAFGAAVDGLRPVAEAFRADPDGPASVHGLAALATSYLAFRSAGVEAVVMETGLGGRFDLVQGLDLALAVITDLGLDHVRALGPDLASIAWHKAGVMRAGVPAVAVRGPGWEVLAREAAAVGAPLVPVEPERLVRRSAAGPVLDLPRLGEVPLAEDVGFPLRNAAVAGRALAALAEAGWPIDAGHVAAGLRAARLPGRLERVGDGVVLDGAHNAQKLAALADALGLGPREAVVVVGLSGQRALDLGPLAPAARAVVATEPTTLYGKAWVPAAEVARAAARAGVPPDAVEVEPVPARALARARGLAAGGPVVVTGSLYVAGEAREAFYPGDEVLLQRTSWPIVEAPPADLLADR